MLVTAFKNRPAPKARSAPPASTDPPARSLYPSAKRGLLALPAVAALVWVVPMAAYHSSPLRQMRRVLLEFREPAPGNPSPNRAMSAALIIRSRLLTHPFSHVSAAQAALLLGILSGPADDMTQSEALDVLGIAKRRHALSPAQEQAGLTATLAILGRSPGPMVRLESARLLGHLGNAGALPALRTLEADSDPKVQKAAAAALAQMRT